MTNITKDLLFFKQRREGAEANEYKKPKVILVDIDGTVVKPSVKMYSMSEENLGKEAIADLEKNKIKPLRKRMINREISFEKYLLELSRIDIELGEYYKDYKDFFFEIAGKGLINVPLVKALGKIRKDQKVKVIFLTSNLKIFGEIISDNVLRLVGDKGKFDGAVGAEYVFDKSGKAIDAKTLISHDDRELEGVKFVTKITAISNYFKKNNIKVDSSEVAVISDADTELMKHYGLGGLVLYPWEELSDQFREIEYVRNARKGLFDFCVDYGKEGDLAQRKWELILSNPNLLKLSDKDIRNRIENKNNRVIAFYGPAGVGKTAIAGKLCRKMPGKSVRISNDILRDMGCMEYKSVQQTDEYITLMKKAILPLTENFLDEGYNVIIDVAPPTPEDKGKTDQWLARRLKKLNALTFFLDAPLQVVLKRNKYRKGKFGQGNLNKKLTEQLYKYCEQYLDKKDYIVLNTGKFGADKTTSLILEKLK